MHSSPRRKLSSLNLRIKYAHWPEARHRAGPVDADSSVTTVSTLSADGRRIAWNHGDKVVVRELASGQELTLSLDGALLGFTVVVAIATVLGSLVADVLYAVADPRVRYS